MNEDFASAYDEQVWGVYGFFAYRVRSTSDAEDLTQRTFERAWRAWRRFDPQRGPLRVWLLAIARNVLADHYTPLDFLPVLEGWRERSRFRFREGSLKVFDFDPYSQALSAVESLAR